MQLYDEDFRESEVVRSTTEHTVVGVQCLLVGDNLARYTIWDGLRALDYLLSRKEVDSSRIGWLHRWRRPALSKHPSSGRANSRRAKEVVARQAALVKSSVCLRGSRRLSRGARTPHSRNERSSRSTNRGTGGRGGAAWPG